MLIHGDAVLIAEKDSNVIEWGRRTKAAGAVFRAAALAIMAESQAPKDHKVNALMGPFAVFTSTNFRGDRIESMRLVDTTKKLPELDLVNGVRHTEMKPYLTVEELRAYEASFINNPDYIFAVTEPKTQRAVAAALDYASVAGSRMVAKGGWVSDIARRYTDYYDNTTDTSREVQIYDYNFGKSGEGNVTNYNMFARYSGDDVANGILNIAKTKAGNTLAAVESVPVGQWGSARPLDFGNPTHVDLVSEASEVFRTLAA